MKRLCFFCTMLLVFFFVGTVHAKENAGTTNQGKQKVDELSNKLKELEQQVKELKEEARARRKLKATREEKTRKEKEVLSAVSRKYTLLRQGALELEYAFIYTYNSSDVIKESLEIEPRYDHTLRNNLTAQYGILNNLSFSTTIPLVYRYNKRGTSQSMHETDVGDISLSLQFQPIKSGEGLLATILYASATIPSGRSPYDIDPETEMSTGSGYYSYSAGINLSKPIDPVVAFGSISYTYTKDVNSVSQPQTGGAILEKVDPGDGFNASLGMAYAMSYRVSLNFSFQYSYDFSTKYFFSGGGRYKTADSTSAYLSLGSGWKLNPKTSVYVSVGIGLTRDASDFSLSFRLPFSF